MGELPVGSTALTLASLGYTPVPVATGEEALTVTLAAPPALVISDAELPGMSGLEVCQRLKENAARRAIPSCSSPPTPRTSGLQRTRRAWTGYSTSPSTGTNCGQPSTIFRPR